MINNTNVIVYISFHIKQKNVIKGKGLKKKKKINLKFTVDCTHPVEDNIMDVASFVSICTQL